METRNSIDQQTKPQNVVNALGETIANAKSLAIVAMGADIQTFKPTIINDYWGALVNVLSHAEELCTVLIHKTDYESKSKLRLNGLEIINNLMTEMTPKA